jgi:hypothetical protein
VEQWAATRNVDLSASGGVAAIFAVFANDLNILKFLVSKNVPLANNDYQILSVAAQYGRQQIVEYIFSNSGTPLSFRILLPFLSAHFSLSILGNQRCPQISVHLLLLTPVSMGIFRSSFRSLPRLVLVSWVSFGSVLLLQIQTVKYFLDRFVPVTPQVIDYAAAGGFDRVVELLLSLNRSEFVFGLLSFFASLTFLFDLTEAALFLIHYHKTCSSRLSVCIADPSYDFFLFIIILASYLAYAPGITLFIEEHCGDEQHRLVLRYLSWFVFSFSLVPLLLFFWLVSDRFLFSRRSSFDSTAVEHQDVHHRSNCRSLGL